MKKGLLYLGMMAVAMGFATSNVNAQEATTEDVVAFTLEEMATISTTTGVEVLTLTQPVGGEAIVSAVKDDSYINYTSIVSGELKNKIQVELSEAIPAGTTLTITAALPTGGNGTPGVINTASFTSNEIAVLPLITAIGSCYSGEGNVGANLTYTWSVNALQYALVKSAEAANITATYTIVAGQ
jgi:hypothetical protein